jgi:hypothetical protein
MKTYKSFNELNGNTLAKGDIVVFNGNSYFVPSNSGPFLSSKTTAVSNDRPFIDAGFHTERLIRELASLAYGYTPSNGTWPPAAANDYEALTRLVLVLFQFLDGKEKAEVNIDGDRFFVDKAANKIKVDPIDKVEVYTSTVEVSVEFVKRAHKAACTDWKKNIENEFPHLFMNDTQLIQKVVDKVLSDSGAKLYFIHLLARRGDISIARIGGTCEYVVNVPLPSANTEWTFEVFEFVKKFCDVYKIENPRHFVYPTHGMHKDLLPSDNNFMQIKVAVR